MSREQTFLERLAKRERFERFATNTNEDLHALMESVRRHLDRLLNARHGMSQAQGDYGLPAMVDLLAGSGDHIQVVSEAIRTAIEKYEPRLRRVRVICERDSESPRAQTLGFRIEATLVGRTQEHRVWYETALRGDGAFEVGG